MNTSPVYFTDFRCHPGLNQQQKLRKLLLKAGMDKIDFQDKFVAIKMHFGELGNLAYLRPNYAKTVADLVKELGGRPFLTDCNTLYVGSRKHALEHIDTAYTNGFSPFSTGCHVIIADGLKGTDEVEVPVEGAQYCPTAKIGRALMDADIVISLTHFKGHESTGFGGALKNLGMGGGSCAGKMEMHSNEKPTVDQSLCVGCGRCVAICPKDAIQPSYDAKSEILNAKIAEYSKAVVAGRPSFHISIVRDISPNCDCHAENDAPIVPDVGMFASFDPVALDVACADAVNRQPVLPHSQLGETAHCDHDDHDHFHAVHPDTDWRSAIAHGVKIGLGNEQYELITVK